QGWGDIKGEVLWGPAALPKAVPVPGVPAGCAAKAPLTTVEYHVNPKNKGVRWVLVYLVDAEKQSKDLPIHPVLAAVPAKAAVIDQPCCEFEPRVLGLREGQKLTIKNPAAIAHNFKIDGGSLGPNDNPLMPPNSDYTINNITARTFPPIPY